MKRTTEATDMGMNRTGISMSPVDSKKTIEGAQKYVPNPSTNTAALTHMRVEVAREAPAIGTMPPPASLKGVAKTAVEAIKGNKATVLIDLLGDRLAFERRGTRLYEALLYKMQALPTDGRMPPRQEVERIRDDELRHFAMLKGAIEKLGADPTVVTPTANVSAVMSDGITKIVEDPRTDIAACLHAIHVAELADHDSWLLLSELAESLGHADMARDFRVALQEEAQHLMKVRAWMAVGIFSEAGADERVGAALGQGMQPTDQVSMRALAGQAQGTPMRGDDVAQPVRPGATAGKTGIAPSATTKPQGAFGSQAGEMGGTTEGVPPTNPNATRKTPRS